MDSTPTNRSFEARRLLREQAGEIAETACYLRSYDKSLTAEQRLSLLRLALNSWAASDLLREASK